MYTTLSRHLIGAILRLLLHVLLPGHGVLLQLAHVLTLVLVALKTKCHQNCTLVAANAAVEEWAPEPGSQNRGVQALSLT
jgi:hypothetical protein